MIKKSIDYQKKVFDLKKISTTLKKIGDGDIESIIVEKKIGENEVEELVFSNSNLDKLKTNDKINSLVIRKNDGTVIILRNNFSLCRASIVAETREIITKIKDILENEIELVEGENIISRSEQMRKKNTSNPLWDEKLHENYDAWIELRGERIYLDGTFSAEQLINIAQKMKNIK